jgi:tetratricopeptide (TPR) repeat protein
VNKFWNVFQRRELKWPPDPWPMFVLGLMLLIAGALGGTLKAGGVGGLDVTGVPVRVAVAALGVALICVSVLKRIRAVFHKLPTGTHHFVGRARELGALQDSVPERGIAAVAGLGGVGKTQLVREYAKRNLSRYDLIWWMDVEDREASAPRDFGELAGHLKLSEVDTQDPKAISRAVNAWLERHRRWLIVFDNALDEDAVREFLPQVDGAARRHVILTSRSDIWSCPKLWLEPWSRKESLAFLAPVTNGHVDEARRLAELLGDLPKALDLALRYVERSKDTLDQYVRDLETRAPHLLEDVSHLGKVTATWVPSLEAATEEAPTAEALMYVCAFLAPTDIPRHLIRDQLELPASFGQRASGDGVWLGEAIGALRRYALIEATEERLSTHRLVQETTRGHMDDVRRTNWAGATVRMLVAGFPERPEEISVWPICADLLPHARAAATHAIEFRADPSATASLLERTGRYFAARAEYADAELTLRSGISMAEETLGDESPVTARLWNQLAATLRERGDFPDARALAERALEVCERTLGPESGDVGDVLANLGRLHIEYREYEDAKAQLKRALAIHEQVRGPDALDVADDLDSLAEALLHQGAWEEASERFRRRTEILESFYGPDHPNARTSRYVLDLLTRPHGNATKSETLQSIIGPLEEIYGDHPKVADLRELLGDEFLRECKLDGAIDSYTRAVTSFSRSKGDGHHVVGRALVPLFAVLAARGRTDEARATVERAFSILKASEAGREQLTPEYLSTLQSALTNLGALPRATAELERVVSTLSGTYGADDPAVAVATNQLACELAEAGDQEAARAHHERAIALLEEHFDEHHPAVAKCLIDLGTMWQNSGDLPQAVATFQRALRAFEQSEPYGNKGIETATATVRLYEVMVLSGASGADALLARARAEFVDAVGPDHPYLADLLMLSASARWRARDPGAVEEYSAARDILVKAYGPDTALVGAPLNGLGEILVDSGHPVDAIEKHLEALAVHERAYGSRHPEVVNDLMLLGRAEYHAGETARARERLERAVELAALSDGPNSQLSRSATRRLGEVCAALGALEEAREHQERAVDIGLALGSAGQPGLMPDLRSLFGTLAQLDDMQAAERMLDNDALDALPQAALALGDGLLLSRRFDDAVRAYERSLARTEGGDDVFLTAGAHERLAVLAAGRDSASEVEAHLRSSLRLRAGADASHAYWGLLLECSTVLTRVQAGPHQRVAVQTAIEALKTDDSVRSSMDYFRPNLVATLPSEWFAKESMTLLAPDGQANIIASGEPLDPSIDTEQYASVQGELLRKEFPEYDEQEFGPMVLFGDRHGYIRTFRWTPPDGVEVTQVQIYYAEGGRGYTATATAPSSEFGPRELLLREALGSLRIGEPSSN